MELAQAGVKTRARALAMAEASVGTRKRSRKVGGGESELSSPLPSVQLSGRRRPVRLDNSGSAASSDDFGQIAHQDLFCSSTSSDHVPESCCSSNGSSQLVKASKEFASPDQASSLSLDDEDVLEIETSTHFRERRETRPSSSEFRAESDEMESSAKPSSEVSSRTRSNVQKKRVFDAELEDFFAESKKLCLQMSEKYNFDFEREIPLEGRYEWVAVKQEENAREKRKAT